MQQYQHKEEFRQTIGQREIVGWNRQEILIDIAVRLKVLRYPKENLPSIIHSNTYNEKGENTRQPKTRIIMFTHTYLLFDEKSQFGKDY